jgi:hypothetical protein
MTGSEDVIRKLGTGKRRLTMTPMLELQTLVRAKSIVEREGSWRAWELELDGLNPLLELESQAGAPLGEPTRRQIGAHLQARHRCDPRREQAAEPLAHPGFMYVPGSAIGFGRLGVGSKASHP